VPYWWEAGEHGYDLVHDEAGRASFAQLLSHVLSGKTARPSHWFTPSGGRHVTVIDGIVNNRKQFIESGIVYNQGVIPSLPSDLAVEVRIMVVLREFNDSRFVPVRQDS
jgi:alpha-galactosidase